MNEEVMKRIKILEERTGKSHQRLLRHENACKPQGSEEITLSKISIMEINRCATEEKAELRGIRFTLKQLGEDS